MATGRTPARDPTDIAASATGSSLVGTLTYSCSSKYSPRPDRELIWRIVVLTPDEMEKSLAGGNIAFIKQGRTRWRSFPCVRRGLPSGWYFLASGVFYRDMNMNTLSRQLDLLRLMKWCFEESLEPNLWKKDLVNTQKTVVFEY